MSTAEELLNSFSADSEGEGHIVIGNDRFITVPEALKRIAVQYGHNIEAVTFDCPRYWDGIDMSTMTTYINYILPDRTLGSYIADNVTVDESDGSIMHFDWNISRNVTLKKGYISFLICIKKTDPDGNEINHWNSELNHDLYISEGLECEETIFEEYVDVITQLLIRMDNVLAANSPILDKSLSISGLAADAGETGKQITVERARINNIIANSTATEGNSELIDIRTGADGIAYNVAGEAVRGQISKLNKNLVNLLDVVPTRNLYDKNSGKYTYGIDSVNLDVQNNSKNLAIIMDVAPNTTYTISGVRSGWNICYEFSASKAEITVGSIATSKLFEGLSYIDATRGYKTITTSSTAKSILLIYWGDGVDTVTEEEKRNALQIEKNNSYTEYVEYGVYSNKFVDIDDSITAVNNAVKNEKNNSNKKYVKNIPLFARCSNGYYWASKLYDLTALCVVGRYLLTGSHLGFKKWDIGVESEPIDITRQLTGNEYLAKNQYIDQWSINPWGTGGGKRIPYKMEFYNGYIYAIVRGGSGYVDDAATERNSNTNVKGETETEGTAGYFIIMDIDLNVLYKTAYYGASKTVVGYRKPSGFVIDEETDRIFISCQLYGWLCYDISNPTLPTLLHSYSPLDESVVSSIDGADLSSKSGPIEYQNGCVFTKDNAKYFACAGYVDGIHIWNVTDIANPTEIKNDIVVDSYGIFWQFRVKESTWDTFAHLFDVKVVGNKMFATIAPTTDHGSDENRISGLVVIDISDLSTPTYKYYPIDSADRNYYQTYGDVKPSHLLVTNDKILLNNGNKGIAVYDNINYEPTYVGCIPSDGDDIDTMVKTDDGRLISGCNIAPYNFRINRGIY